MNHDLDDARQVPTHDLTRRTLIGAGATALAAGAVAAAAPAAQAAPIDAAPRFTRANALYRRRRWLRQRRSTFHVTAPGVRVRMRLVTVQNIPHVTRGSERSFELVFRSTGRGPAQGTYEVRRGRFTRTSLFLVPTDSTRRTYRATVNNR